MKITKTVDFFIQREKFQQLSCCKRWAIGILSLLPALTIFGIIASPFLWKGLVHVYSNKKVKPTKNPSVSAVASKSLPMTKENTPSSSKPIVFLPGEACTSDFKNRFLAFIKAKTPIEIEELAKDPPFDFDGEWQDMAGKIVFGKLHFIFSNLSDEQLRALLKAWFLEANNPSQQLFDACYLTLYDQDKKGLFAEVVGALEGKLNSFQASFLWVPSHHAVKTATIECFLRDMLQLALKENATKDILDALVGNDYYRFYEVIDALENFEFENLSLAETKKLQEWVDTLPRHNQIKEFIAESITSNFSEATSRRAIQLFHEAKAKGILPELLAPLRSKKGSKDFDYNYGKIAPYLTCDVIDKLCQVDEDFFGLNSNTLSGNQLCRIFSENLEEDQILHILKHYAVNGNFSAKVIHNYVVAHCDFNIHYDRLELFLGLLTKKSLIAYFQVCNQQLLSPEDKAFLCHYIEVSLRENDYEESLLLIAKHCPNWRRELFHKNSLGHLLSKEQAEKMMQFMKRYQP